MPVLAGSASRSFWHASSPPAEDPIAMTGKLRFAGLARLAFTQITKMNTLNQKLPFLTANQAFTFGSKLVPGVHSLVTAVRVQCQNLLP